MKKIILILLFITLNSINAQNRIESLDKKKERKEGVYYKDVNGLFDPYIGTWEGKLSNGNTFKITFEKVKEYQEFDKYWEDRLQSRYENRNSIGGILYSTYHSSEIKIRSLSAKKKDIFKLLFSDKCISGYVKLRFIDSLNNKLEWEYDPITQMIPIVNGKEPDCAKINEMPQEKFILTKQ